MVIFKNKNKGFTLVETLVAISLFVIVSAGILSGFVSILKIMSIIRAKGLMTNIANEQFEIIRNLSYEDVGIINSIPSGIVVQYQTIIRDNKTFNVNTIVRNIDDPFDGTFTGTPNDLSPADMKLIEIEIVCQSCRNDVSPITFTTKVAPKDLETISKNGALIIKVFDSSGLPISGADVNITNTAVNPNIIINDVTDINGTLTIVDVPPYKTKGYHVIVTKDGYSTDRTYSKTEISNPQKPDLIVAAKKISQDSFIVDLLSSLDISTMNSQCAPVGNFDFNMYGTKIISSNPNTYKYSENLITNSSGLLNLGDVEWDIYDLLGIDSTYDIVGTNPLLPFTINPNTNQEIGIVLSPKNGRRILLVVKDAFSKLPVANASISITDPGGYTNSGVTNEGFLSQTSWSGGSGQENYIDTNMYFSSDNIDNTTTIGSVSLSKVFGNYVTSGYLISSTFDTGTNDNFKQITWNPTSFVGDTGANSVRFQIASNNDNLTWNFIGPDGTSSTHYTLSNQNINSVHNGNRYIRYKLYLSTENTLYTPIISDIYITYSSECIPPGQLSFSGLASGTYSLSITKNGYITDSASVTIPTTTPYWYKKEILLNSQ